MTLRPIPPSPCNPPPCGPNSQCTVVSGQAQCGCLVGMIGSAPNCRPECVISSDCPSGTACVNQKCVDPCPGTCGSNAECQVVNHSPSCTCASGFTGNAFADCRPIPVVGKIVIRFVSLWRPSCLVPKVAIFYLNLIISPVQSNRMWSNHLGRVKRLLAGVTLSVK